MTRSGVQQELDLTDGETFDLTVNVAGATPPPRFEWFINTVMATSSEVPNFNAFAWFLTDIILRQRVKLYKIPRERDFQYIPSKSKTLHFKLLGL